MKAVKTTTKKSATAARAMAALGSIAVDCAPCAPSSAANVGMAIQATSITAKTNRATIRNALFVFLIVFLLGFRFSCAARRDELEYTRP